MNNQRCRHENRIIENFRRTYKNKIAAIALIVIGIVTNLIIDDATILVFMLVIGIPLFFARRNWMV